MKFIYYISCLAILIIISGVSVAAGIATVHGVAYEWSTFEPLDNAVIEVNSTPVQSIVAKYGVYSFELPNGSYLLTAKYYEDGTLSHYGEETITVSDDGNYVVDLLLLPSYSESSDIESSLVNTDTSGDDSESISEEDNGINMLAGASVVIILVLILLFYQVRFGTRTLLPGSDYPKAKRHVVTEKTEKKELKGANPADENDTTPAEAVESHDDRIEEVSEEDSASSELSGTVPDSPDLSSEPVPPDLQEILDILKSQGGRMTQKDMRKRLKYSEGKVSLMLLDLENRGKIRKFKKGRGNVLFLVDEEE